MEALIPIGLRLSDIVLQSTFHGGIKVLDYRHRLSKIRREKRVGSTTRLP